METNADVSSVTTKKFYAFGTPNHGKTPFSDFCHLDNVNRSFAVQLTHSEKDLPVVIRHERPKPSTAVKPLPEEVAAALPEVKKGVPPCVRPDCKEIVNQIIEIVASNQVERNEILYQCEKSISLVQQLDEETSFTENDNKRLLADGNMLEIKYNKILSLLNKQEQVKSTLDAEKDELNSKVSMYTNLPSFIFLRSLFIFTHTYLDHVDGVRKAENF